MIDIGKLRRRIAVMAMPDDETTVTRRCLEQMVAELSAARSAGSRAPEPTARAL
ncbi:MAG: hypothetical protein WCZ28_11315 [Burkholderiaceae bacterium]